MKQQRGRHGLVPVILNLCILGCLCLVLPGCGSDSDDDPVALPSGTLAESYADRAVLDWAGVDFSNANSCDGVSDSDGDGPVDAYDAVMIIKTWQRLGFDVPDTTVHGLYANDYLAENGFNRQLYDDSQPGDRLPFAYTVDHGLGQDDLVAAAREDDPEGVTWTTLATHPDHPLLKGDLIFADYDKNDVWDFAAVYLGAWGEITHAALLVSDYYDAAVVTDLDARSVFQVDIAYGYSDVRRPAYAAMSAHQTTPDATAPTASFCHEAVGADYTVTITFSAGMSGFVEQDITPGNATIKGFTAEETYTYTEGSIDPFTRTNASVYKVTLTPVAEGDVTLIIPAGAALGSNGKTNAEASYTITR